MWFKKLLSGREFSGHRRDMVRRFLRNNKSLVDSTYESTVSLGNRAKYSPHTPSRFMRWKPGQSPAGWATCLDYRLYPQTISAEILSPFSTYRVYVRRENYFDWWKTSEVREFHNHHEPQMPFGLDVLLVRDGAIWRVSAEKWEDHDEKRIEIYSWPRWVNKCRDY